MESVLNTGEPKIPTYSCEKSFDSPVLNALSIYFKAQKGIGNDIISEPISNDFRNLNT